MTRPLRPLAGRTIFAIFGMLVIGACLFGADPARGEDVPRAENVVVILDRGRDAKPRANEDVALAARIARAAGKDVPLLLQAARPDGGPRSGEAKGASEADLAEDARSRTKGAFEGESDPRLALATAQKRYAQAGRGPAGPRATGPWLVVLVGPFGAGGGAAAEQALAAWNEKAPEGSRVLVLGAASAALDLLADVRGFVTEGLVVLGFGAVEAEAAPFSPFARDEEGRPPPLEAVLRVPLEAYPVGRGPGDPVRLAVLEAASGMARDRVERIAADSPDSGSSNSISPAPGSPAPDSPAPPSPSPDPPERGRAGVPAALAFHLLREREEGRVATVAFQAVPSPDVLLLAAPPPARTITWDRLAPDARLVAADDGPVAPFRVTEGAIGKSYTARSRILRTRVGPAPVWSVEGDTAALTTGLSVHVAPEVFTSDEIAESLVTFHFAPTPETPRRAEGRLLLASRDLNLAFAVPYALDVLPGRLSLRLEAPDAPLALPRASSDAPWHLEASPTNANAPAEAAIAAVVVPPTVAPRLHFRFLPAGASNDLAAPEKASERAPEQAVETPAEKPAVLKTGVRYRLLVALHPGDRGEGLDGTRVSFVLAETPGVEAEPSGSATLRSRRPRLVATPSSPRYRVVDGGADGEVVAEAPLLLTIDPDGGDGAWLAGLAALPPLVTAPPGGPVAFALEAAGPTAWTLTAVGGWKGGRADAFSGREVKIAINVSWPGGVAPEVVEVVVAQPPRWGALGYVLLAFAGLALALALFAWRQMRPPPLTGTILWAAEGLEGVVGRLDLSAAPRGPISLRSDAEGRLSLGGTTGSEVLRLRPTRVGGLVEVPADRAVGGPVAGGPAASGAGGGAAGGTRGGIERRLLADGLTLEVGRHRLRYLAGGFGGTGPIAPIPAEEAADLLGPEYDMAGGTLRDATPLGRPAEDGTAGDGTAGDGAAGDGTLPDGTARQGTTGIPDEGAERS